MHCICHSSFSMDAGFGRRSCVQFLSLFATNAFGACVWNFGSQMGHLQRTFRYAIRDSSRIVRTAMKPHNFVVAECCSSRKGLNAVEVRQVYTESLKWHRQRTRSANTGRETARIMVGSKRRDRP